MPEWLVPFIGGVIATSFGSLLTMLFYHLTYKKEKKERETAILLAFKEELESNSSIIEDNKKIIEEELKLLQEFSEKIVKTPLNLLESGFWDLVKINLPQKLVKAGILVKIRNIVLLTNKINEEIRSRENFRISTIIDSKELLSWKS